MERYVVTEERGKAGFGCHWPVQNRVNGRADLRRVVESNGTLDLVVERLDEMVDVPDLGPGPIAGDLGIGPHGGYLGEHLGEEHVNDGIVGKEVLEGCDRLHNWQVGGNSTPQHLVNMFLDVSGLLGHPDDVALCLR